MPATAIDTLKFAQVLDNAGFTRGQTEAQANFLNDALTKVTPQDLI